MVVNLKNDITAMQLIFLLGAFICLPTVYTYNIQRARNPSYDIIGVKKTSVGPEWQVNFFKQLQKINKIIKMWQDQFQKSKSKQNPLRCNLAVSYGTLNETVLQRMDHNLQVMIGSSVDAVGELISQKGVNNLKFSDYVNALTSNKYIHEDPEGHISREKEIEFSFVGLSEGKSQYYVAMRVETWYSGELIQLQNVLDSTDINLNDFKNLVSATGASVDSFETFFFKNVHDTQNVVDIGVLRYPDPSYPYLQLYRISLNAYRSTKRILFFEETHSGIKGTFTLHQFVPNSGVIDKMDPEHRERLLKAANDIFMD